MLNLELEYWGRLQSVGNTPDGGEERGERTSHMMTPLRLLHCHMTLGTGFRIFPYIPLRS